MDSSRSSKGASKQNKQISGDSKSTTGLTTSSIPLAIRFHAGEESVEQILPQSVPSGSSLDSSSASSSNIIDNGRNSLSSSPQFGSDDFSWRKDFLPNSFFHRKRSGSVEGSGGTSPGSSAISNSFSASGTDPNTVGTWKLIKGKVSQAMEDIKSKNTQASTTQPVSAPILPQKEEYNGETDPETSDDISNELSATANTKHMQKDVSTSDIQNAANDSDFDADAEILDFDSTQIYIPAPVVRKPFASLRAKASPTSVKAVPVKQATNAGGGGESNFFRMRKKDKKEDSSVPARTKSKRDVEIESGVEMLEDMVLPQSSFVTAAATSSAKSNSQTDIFEKCMDEEPLDNLQSDDHSPNTEQYHKLGMVSPSPAMQEDLSKDFVDTGLQSSVLRQDSNDFTSLGQLLRHCFASAYKSRSIIVAVALLGVLFALPLADFFQGIIVCLLIISLFSWSLEVASVLLERSDLFFHFVGMATNGPERTPFRVPDYKTLPICEVPAVEEHKPLKSYAGWMSEINNYDPSNFHISMTRPVYVRLDGSFLKIYSTGLRVPKRAMWNEPPIHRKNAKFTGHRLFNLAGCRVEMCPRGLARKRHFSRKYPIQLIIHNKETTKLDDSRFGDARDTGTASIPIKSDSSNNTTQDFLLITHQSSNESNDDHSERQSCDFDFATTVLHSNLQKLHDSQQKDDCKDTIPYGDETRLLLFARCDREKEDWYRRFLAASIGNVNDVELHNADFTVLIDERTIDAMKSLNSTESFEESTTGSEGTTNETSKSNKKITTDVDNDTFEGLVIASNAARITYEYVKFMSLYQKLELPQKTPDRKVPIFRTHEQAAKQNRRMKKQDDLWKGVDQEMFLGSSSGVVWANVLIGRVLYSCLNDQALLIKIQDFLQKKLSAIKLPSFMEDVVISQTYLGDTPPIIHRISQPLLDERGIWIDADITYEGLMHMTITTKLNLLRLKRQQQQQQQHHQAHDDGAAASSPGNGNEAFKKFVNSEGGMLTESTVVSAPAGDVAMSSSVPVVTFGAGTTTDKPSIAVTTINSAIYDSDAESSGASSSDSEAPPVGVIDPSQETSSTTGTSPGFYNTPGNSRRFFRIVDRITASNLFQSATEISYIQRAMENMSTKITLRVELKGLVARVVLNLPPPPSDRLWIAFRGPPRLWISAKPAVGDHTFDWSIVTNVIESKLCDEVYKYLVYPNMVDIIAPFLGPSTYKE